MARTAIETVVEARRNKKKKKKKKEAEQKLIDAPNIVPAPEPAPAPIPEQPSQYFASDTMAQKVFGTPNPTHSQRLELDYALMQGQGNIKGFGPDRGFTAQQTEIAQGQAAQEAGFPAAEEQLKQAGAFEEVTPERTELSPEVRSPIGKLPVLGVMSEALASILLPQKYETAEGIGFDMPLTEESVRERALRDIRDKSYSEGVTLAESFGTLVESIPVIGSLARKWAAGLIETPSANADNVIAEIDKVKEAASTGQEKVRNGLEDPDYGLDRARSMEEQIAALEGRLKALINSSPILRANTDEVNRIEEGILEAREKVARYRQAATYGLTAGLTGTGRIIPTDEQMFLALKEGK